MLNPKPHHFWWGLYFGSIRPDGLSNQIDLRSIQKDITDKYTCDYYQLYKN